MDTLKHFAFPVPPYSTSPGAPGQGRRRVVQFTRTVAVVDGGHSEAITYAQAHDEKRAGLARAIDTLTDARTAWVGCDEGNGSDFEHLGDNLALAAGEVLDLIGKVGY